MNAADDGRRETTSLTPVGDADFPHFMPAELPPQSSLPSPAIEQPAHARSVAWYALLMVGLQVVMLAASFWATLQPWFFDHANAPLLGVMGYGAEARALNCDVVLYGDSTALADFVPSVIERKTGLKACNIAELRSLADCVGVDVPVDQYLRNNKRPLFLVAGFTPDNLNFEHERLRRTEPENLAYALRYDRGPWLWKGLLKRPEATLRLVAWAEGALINGAVRRVAAKLRLAASPDASDAPRTERVAQRGQWATKDPPQTQCVQEPLGPDWTHSQAAAGLAAFRQRYGVAGTQVIIYATPIANCDADLGLEQSRVKGLTDYPLETLPPGAFNLRDVHLAQPAAEAFSDRVADDLLARMHAVAKVQQGADAR